MLSTADAELAVVTAAAEDMYQAAPLNLRPPVDPRVTAIGLTVKSYITAIDQLLDLGASRVYYGFFATLPTGGAVVAIRGTQRAIEWLKDAEGAQRPHPVAGAVHAGFWDIYASMRLLPPAGADEQPLAAGIAALLSKGQPVTFCGHSLGSPLATYGMFDLATLREFDVAGRLIASPRPGNAAFSAAASAAVPNHAAYAYSRDLVPKVPFGFGYEPLANLIEIPANDAIPDDPGSAHHAMNYAWLLDPAVVPGGPV